MRDRTRQELEAENQLLRAELEAIWDRLTEFFESQEPSDRKDDKYEERENA